jgi:hypothetical protein
MNFDLNKHIKAYPPDTVKPFDRDNLVYILSLITRIPARAERHDSAYVFIKAEYLKNRIRNYKKYLDYAIQSGIIETNGHYLPGKRSLGYKFTDQFMSRVKGEPIVKYSLIKQDNSEREAKNGATEKKYSYLTKHFNESLSFDYEGAKQLLISNSTTDENYNYNLVRLDELNEKNYRYSVDQTAHRFHSNFTNLKTDFRQFITYGNEELVSVDIKNSQPFFALMLLRPGFYENFESPITFHSIYSNNLPISSPSHLQYISLMIRKCSESYTSKEIQTFSELVLNGQIYEYLAQELFDEKGIVFEDRRELKNEFFHAFYSPNQTIGKPDAHLRRLFRDRFPKVYEIFSLLKKKDHKLFPVLLQRIESFIVVEQICNRIAHIRPYLPIYTVHDSIVTTAGNEGFIEAIMSEEIERLTGYVPNLKIERWTRVF